MSRIRNPRVDPSIDSIRGRYRTNAPSFRDCLGYRYPVPGDKWSQNDTDAFVRLRAFFYVTAHKREMMEEYLSECERVYGDDAASVSDMCGHYHDLLDRGDVISMAAVRDPLFHDVPVIDVAAFGPDDVFLDDDCEVIRMVVSPAERSILGSGHAAMSIEGVLYEDDSDDEGFGYRGDW